MKYLSKFFKFLVNPITDDWNGGISLIRLTFIAIMYGVYQLMEKSNPLDWSYLVIVLFLLMYLCFKGDSAPLISKLIDMVTTIKTSAVSGLIKKEDPKDPPVQ